MKELYYQYIKIREGEPEYKKGELRYHHVRIKDNIDNCVGDYCSTCKEPDYKSIRKIMGIKKKRIQ